MVKDGERPRLGTQYLWSKNMKQIPQWNVYEQVFEISNCYDNPFSEVRLSVRLIHEKSELTIDGFYDGVEENTGKSIWRFRFAPMFTGSWKFRTFSNDLELDSIQGEFSCIEPVTSGGLTVNHQFPNWFFRSDGTPQFILNDGWTPHPGSKYGIEKYGAQVFTYPSEKKFRTFIKVLSSHRVNMIIDLKQLYARQKNCTDPSFLWPWKVIDTETHEIDREQFSLDYFQRLDRQIKFAQDHNVFYGVEVLYDNSTFRKQEWANHPYNESNGGWIRDWDAQTDEYTTDQLPFGWGLRWILNLKNKIHMTYLTRMVSYLVARTAAYSNVFYAMGCETSNIYPGLAGLVNDWYDWWGDYMASKDAHGRLLTIGDVAPQKYGPEYEMDPNTAYTYQNARNNMITTQEHTFTDDINDYADSIYNVGLQFWKFRRPAVIGEQDGRNNNKYWKERRGYWVAFVSGYMMGRIDRHYELADGDQLRESTLFGISGDPAIYTFMENLALFIEKGNVAFWRMKPLPGELMNSTGSVYCLGEMGQEYVLYFTTGGAAEISLPYGIYSYCWYNPRAGLFSKEGLCQSGMNSFKAADKEDWTLLIKKTGEP